MNETMHDAAFRPREPAAKPDVPPEAAAPIAFGPADRPLFGMFHPEARGMHRGVAVVLCNPFGYEAMCVHRAYRHAAERLAAAGFAVLRFDYQGTGDSSGRLDEPARLRAWIDSVHAAIGAVRARSGVERVSLFGVRLGATLAATAAAEAPEGVGSLVAWAPVVSGRAYVREMRAFRKLQGLAASHADGTEEVAGYALSAETIADLGALDLLATKLPPAPRVLVVPRDDLPGAEERLVRHVRACGGGADLETLEGYAAMMRDAQLSVVPDAALDAIVAWLVRVHPVTTAKAAVASRRGEASFATEDDDGRRVRERALTFGPGERLVGIVTEPDDAPPAASRPAVLFLNVGSNHRVGPNRMYVRLARSLAARGFRAFRFDVAGIGDSRPEDGARENRLYSKDSVGDVVAAMDHLAAAFGTSRFVLAGLCSGAYLAFHTAIEDARVAGQVLLNPQTFDWKEGDSLEISIRKSYKSTSYYQDALLDARVWAKALRGEVNVRGIAKVLGARLVTRARGEAKGLLARLRRDEAPATDVERGFRAMSERGARSLLVFSASDGGRDILEAHLGPDGRRMRGRPGFRLAIIEGADHTFTPLGSQRAVMDLIVRDLDESFGGGA